MQLLTRVFTALRRRGLIRAMQGAVSAIEDSLFDFRLGLQTSEMVHVADLDISDENKIHSSPYRPTRIRYFHKLMALHLLPTDFIFVDVGCGKGRIVIAAARHGFRRIVGIEISPQLVAMARRNVDRFRSRTGNAAEIDIQCANVLEVELPHDNQVLYLYRPFDRHVMTQFIDELRESIRLAPRDVWLIVNEVSYRDVFERDRLFSHVTRFVYGAGEFDVYHHEPRRAGDREFDAAHEGSSGSHLTQHNRVATDRRRGLKFS
jgi:SAM-dependent methyltransferase